MRVLFKKWEKESETFKDFVKKYSWWLMFQDIDPDNCYSDEVLERYYNMYKGEAYEKEKIL